MATNRGVVYMGPGEVGVQGIDFPKLALGNRKCEHGVILKIASTNLCGRKQMGCCGSVPMKMGRVLGADIGGTTTRGLVLQVAEHAETPERIVV